jgi:hypothetical protein
LAARLADADPVINFAYENFADVLKEPGFKALCESHFLEISEDQDKLPFRVDWQQLLDFAAKGMFIVYIARDDGRLIGYSSFMLGPDISTRTTGAWDGPWYLDPDYRSTGQGLLSTGFRLLADPEMELQRRGVRRVRRHVKISTFKERGGLVPLFERQGYRPFEVSLSKIL